MWEDEDDDDDENSIFSLHSWIFFFLFTLSANSALYTDLDKPTTHNCLSMSMNNHQPVQ